MQVYEYKTCGMLNENADDEPDIPLLLLLRANMQFLTKVLCTPGTMWPHTDYGTLV
jgi:hypothetical protein